jgi:hypothetical protein
MKIGTRGKSRSPRWTSTRSVRRADDPRLTLRGANGSHRCGKPQIRLSIMRSSTGHDGLSASHGCLSPTNSSLSPSHDSSSSSDDSSSPMNSDGWAMNDSGWPAVYDNTSLTHCLVMWDRRGHGHDIGRGRMGWPTSRRHEPRCPIDAGPRRSSGQAPRHDLKPLHRHRGYPRGAARGRCGVDDVVAEIDKTSIRRLACWRPDETMAPSGSQSVRHRLGCPASFTRFRACRPAPRLVSGG